MLIAQCSGCRIITQQVKSLSSPWKWKAQFTLRPDLLSFLSHRLNGWMNLHFFSRHFPSTLPSIPTPVHAVVTCLSGAKLKLCFFTLYEIETVSVDHFVTKMWQQIQRFLCCLSFSRQLERNRYWRRLLAILLEFRITSKVSCLSISSASLHFLSTAVSRHI